MIEPNEADIYLVDMNLVDEIMKEIETAHAKRGTPATWSREAQLAVILENLGPINAIQCITDNWYCIKEPPNHRFATSDGRTFGLFFDGGRILNLFEREKVYINHRDKAGLQRIKNVAGAIVEMDEDGAHDPIVYEHRDDLATAWAELHRMHRVPYPLNQLQSAYHMKLFWFLVFRGIRNILDFSMDCGSEGVHSIKFLLAKLGSMLKHSA
jgi:hypothetical protein